MPINRAAFWLVLAVGGIVILVKLIALWFRASNKTCSHFEINQIGAETKEGP